jgi:hypothetical protein
LGCVSRVACDKLTLHSLKALRSFKVQVIRLKPSTLGWRECRVVMPGWLPQRAEIGYRSSACPEIDRADWRSWDSGSPGDGSLFLPEVGNPRRTPCN